MRPSTRCTAVLTLLGALFALDATAATTSRDVLGWTAHGDVVTHVTARGSRMVDGTSQDYYVEATEVWTDGAAPRRFQHGEPRGPVPHELAATGAAETGDAFRDGLTAGLRGTTNRTGTRHIAWYATHSFEPRGTSTLCKVAYRVLLFDAESATVSTLHTGSVTGVHGPLEDTSCPRVNVEVSWSDAERGFVLITDETDVIGKFLSAATDPKPFTPTLPLIARLPTPQQPAWHAVLAGDSPEAQRLFETTESAGGVAFVAALSGKKNAQSLANAAFEKSKKSGRDAILRAATYVILGKASSTTGWIDEAVRNATSYAELLEFAAIFQLADAAIANQLAVHALSHASAEQADTADGWRLLATGLMDVGEYSKAEEALAKVPAEDVATRQIAAVLQLDRKRGKPEEVVATLLQENPADCAAWHLQGRVASAANNNVLARASFRAAHACDPTLSDAAFYVADFARLAGDVAASKQAFEHFLRITTPRRTDPIRDARRSVASDWAIRFRHEGVVITDVACRPGGAGQLCIGTLKNTTAAPSGAVAVEVSFGKKSVGKATIEEIAAGATAPFSVSFQAAKSSGAKVSAGRNAAERKANERTIP